MAKVTIPDAAKNTLNWTVDYLEAATDDEFRNVVTSFSNAPASIDIKPLSSYIQKEIGANTTIASQEVIQNLISMNVGRLSKNVPADEFVKEVIIVLKENGKTVSEKAGERLTELLDLNSLFYSSRASDLQQECGNLFLDSRILSDVRMVFNKDCSAAAGAVIMHSLKIEYFQGMNRKEFFLTLDADDISKLKDVLKRAEDKEKILNTMIIKAELEKYA
ncbi:MAG: hypothetical protein WC464_00360 [Bdellovibrionales bacterium]